MLEKSFIVQDATLLERIEKALETIRPHLQADGGNIEVVEVTEEGLVRLRWLGACESCSMSAMTMRAGIEHTLKTNVPEVKAVEAVNGLL